MFSLHLTHPSVHTWTSCQSRDSNPSNLGLPRVSSPMLYPLGQRLPMQLAEVPAFWSVCTAGTRNVFSSRNSVWEK